MMKRFTIVFAMIALPFAVWADSGQTVSVGGTTVNKTVKDYLQRYGRETVLYRRCHADGGYVHREHCLWHCNRHQNRE